jgi:hypothetical protein
MQRRSLLRRSLFGALVSLVTGSVLGHSGHTVEAAKNNPTPRPDYASKEAFRLECILLGGTFSEDANGNTNCHYPGGWVQCDANGKDCWHQRTAWSLSPGGVNGFDGSLAAVATDGGKKGKGKKRRRADRGR